MRGPLALLLLAGGAWAALVVGGIGTVPGPDTAPHRMPVGPLSPPAPKTPLTLVVYSSPGCAPCAHLKQSLADPAVQDALRGWEVRQEGPAAARGARVTAYPTIVVLRGTEEKGRQVGYQTPEALVSWLRSLAN